MACLVKMLKIRITEDESQGETDLEVAVEMLCVCLYVCDLKCSLGRLYLTIMVTAVVGFI